MKLTNTQVCDLKPGDMFIWHNSDLIAYKNQLKNCVINTHFLIAISNRSQAKGIYNLWYLDRHGLASCVPRSYYIFVLLLT